MESFIVWATPFALGVIVGIEIKRRRKSTNEMLGKIIHDANGHPSANPATFWGELLSCQYCCTIWLGVLAAAAYWAMGVAAVWLALPFALSAAALWFNKVIRG